jgi:succinate dehydrogenase assembly factor 2
MFTRRAALLSARAVALPRRAFAPRFLCSGGDGPRESIKTQAEAQASLRRLDAAARDHELRHDYESMRTEFPAASMPTDGTSLTPDEAHRKRLIYRSKQRGWLEVDLLLGNFATEHVMTMSHEELGEYERILAEETINIFNYVSGKDPLPPQLEKNSVMQRLQTFAQTNGMRKLRNYQ